MIRLKKPGTPPPEEIKKQEASQTASVYKSSEKTNLNSVNDKLASMPSKGAGYHAFLDWASDEALEPSVEDRLLAIKAWKGEFHKDSNVDNKNENASVPKM